MVFFILVPCLNGQYCCSKNGIGGSSCCNDTSNTFPVQLGPLLLQNVSPPVQEVASSPSSTTAATSLSCTGGVFTGPNPSASSCPANHTTEVGASVGAVLGTMFLAAVAWVLILKQRLMRARQQQRGQSNQTPISGNWVSQDGGSGYEVDGARAPQEMMGNWQLPELHGSR